MQQRVEILKMLYRDNDILIFDEPTAVLTPQEIDELMGIMKQLVDEGKSIIFITHKLNEIKRVADRVTILRNGKLIDTVPNEGTSLERMSELMVGRKVNLDFDLGVPNLGETVLKVRDLSLSGDLHGHKPLSNVNFDLKRGEILCIAGIDGNGQSELVYALTGLIQGYSGKISLLGNDITKASIRYRNTHGLSHIPEDRQKYGLVLEYNLAENLVLQTYFDKKYHNFGFINEEAINEHADALIKDFDIRSGQGKDTITRSMSGGNQQKAIVAREIERDHEVLIAVQPTRGLDVGAIEYVHKRLIEERDAGKAVLLVSLELSEVMGVSDRIIVMYEGEMVGELNPHETTEQELGLYMSGVKRGEISYE
jgi:general nucleoside transport system ATP-binding protein